jgi:hypothetical protein
MASTLLSRTFLARLELRFDMDISSALEILRSATAESLQCHHQDVLKTLAEVQRRLNVSLVRMLVIDMG